MLFGAATLRRQTNAPASRVGEVRLRTGRRRDFVRRGEDPHLGGRVARLPRLKPKLRPSHASSGTRLQIGVPNAGPRTTTRSHSRSFVPEHTGALPEWTLSHLFGRDPGAKDRRTCSKDHLNWTSAQASGRERLSRPPSAAIAALIRPGCTTSGGPQPEQPVRRHVRSSPASASTGIDFLNRCGHFRNVTLVAHDLAHQFCRKSVSVGIFSTDLRTTHPDVRAGRLAEHHERTLRRRDRGHEAWP